MNHDCDCPKVEFADRDVKLGLFCLAFPKEGPERRSMCGRIIVDGEPFMSVATGASGTVGKPHLGCVACVDFAVEKGILQWVTSTVRIVSPHEDFDLATTNGDKSP